MSFDLKEKWAAFKKLFWSNKKKKEEEERLRAEEEERKAETWARYMATSST